ncbi:MAG: hypothetical protein Q7T45_16640 [Bradyrhizobium sp.]|nr:hypothetical protein [Bradyrhizobium sp.]MDO8399441.1 hypothetical protein [Bradyrhizobium sp.]
MSATASSDADVGFREAGSVHTVNDTRFDIAPSLTLGVGETAN